MPLPCRRGVVLWGIRIHANKVPIIYQLSRKRFVRAPNMDTISGDEK